MFMSFINVTNSFQIHFISPLFLLQGLSAGKISSMENREQKRVQFLNITAILETNQEDTDIERLLQYVFQFSLLLQKT